MSREASDVLCCLISGKKKQKKHTQKNRNDYFVDDMQEMTEDNGVTKFGDDSGRVERLKRGMSIKVSNDHASGVLQGLEMASNVAGIVSQAGNIANMIVAHPLKQAAREASPSKKTLLPFGGS